MEMHLWVDETRCQANTWMDILLPCSEKVGLAQVSGPSIHETTCQQAPALATHAEGDQTGRESASTQEIDHGRHRFRERCVSL